MPTRPPPILVAAFFLWLPTPAWAQPVDNRALGDEQFRLGREAMTQGDYPKALRLFRRSQELDPGNGKVLNEAICEEKLGLFASAQKHLLEVQQQLPPGDPRAAMVKGHLDAVTPQVPHLRIQRAPGAASETTVTLDGEPVAASSLGVDVPVDPGQHVVTATAPGATEKRYEVTLASSDQRTLEVAAQVTGAALPNPEPRGAAWTLGVVALAAGGASLIAGIGTGVAAITKHASTVPQCPRGPTMCPPGEQPDIDTYNRLGAASTATFILGGALAATGVILVVTSRRGDKPATRAWIAPVVGMGVLGARGGF
jgi:hypothetical protein